MTETGCMRSRWHILAQLCLLASLLAAGIVSASTALDAENRIRGLDRGSQDSSGAAARSATLGTRMGYALVYDDLASESLLVARGATRYGDDAASLVGRRRAPLQNAPYQPVRNAPETIATTYRYDRNGNLTELRYPTSDAATRQGRTSYAYDGADRISLVKAEIYGSTMPVAEQFQYMPFGPRTRMTFSNGLVDARTFDRRYRLGTWTLGNSPYLLRYDHSYDEDSNLTLRTDYKTPANSRVFAYDVAHRLTVAEGPWGAGSGCDGATYTYDANGNRFCKGESGTATTYSYSMGTNRLASSSGGETAEYDYYPAGNTKGDGTHTYDYDDGQRLMTVDASPTPTYTYDGDGRRTSKSVGGTRTYYFYDFTGRLITEMILGQNCGTADGKDYVYLHGAPVARADWSIYDVWGGDCPLSGTGECVEGQSARYVYDDLFYYHTDHLGTPVAMTDVGGSFVWRQEYLPFGGLFPSTNSVALVANNLRFPGQYFDAETGLHQNWFRDYDPKTGRYREADPIGLAGGTNAYEYAAGNPLTFRDPVGKAAETVLDVASIGLSAYEFWRRPSWANAGYLAWDVGAAAVPFVPGSYVRRGANLVRRAVREGGEFCGAAAARGVNLANPARTRHILDGDVLPHGAFSGGHRAGTGFPGKSEFPASWSDDQIMHQISDVATDPLSAVRPGRGGDVFVTGTRRGVDIEVLLRNGEIWTGYPTNVPRNP